MRTAFLKFMLFISDYNYKKLDSTYITMSQKRQ